MNNEPITGAESLQIIQEMIQKARNQFSENGHLYLLWGYVILVCCLLQFILKEWLKVEQYYAVWGLTWLAFFYQMYYIFKKRKQAKVKTYTDTVLKYVWTAFVATMFVLSFVISGFSAQFKFDAQFMYLPVLLALYGVPTFLSGAILNFKPLRTGGVICWILALVSMYMPEKYVVLLVAAAVVIAWIVPGYLLRRHYKKQQA